MELTVQTLREVTFGQKVRGYDPADVDDFIDQIAEGLEELHKRLRDADARAESAEAQLASGGTAAVVAAPVAPAAPAAPTPSDIGKMFERAAASAEALVDEARQEASRILEEARSNAAAAEAAVEEARQEASRLKEDARTQARHEADQTIATARSEAESTLNNSRQEADNVMGSARTEAEATLNNARAEAARLAEESQGQLRYELEQLEAARTVLQNNVDSLAGYVDSELGKVRGALEAALASVNDASNGVSEAPRTAPAEVPAPRYGEGVAIAAPVAGAAAGYETPTFDTTSSSTWEEPSNQGWDQGEQASTDSADASWTQPEQTNDWQQSESNEPQDAWGNTSTEDVVPWETQNDESNTDTWREPAEDTDNWSESAAQGEGQPASAQPYDHEEAGDDVDPFLAELRRAVHDDGPLGPRDEEPQSDENSIDHLYSNDDDDKNGFFRRRK